MLHAVALFGDDEEKAEEGLVAFVT